MHNWLLYERNETVWSNRKIIVVGFLLNAATTKTVEISGKIHDLTVQGDIKYFSGKSSRKKLSSGSRPSSVIFTLLCHFHWDQQAAVGGKQTSLNCMVSLILHAQKHLYYQIKLKNIWFTRLSSTIVTNTVKDMTFKLFGNISREFSTLYSACDKCVDNTTVMKECREMSATSLSTAALMLKYHPSFNILWTMKMTFWNSWRRFDWKNHLLVGCVFVAGVKHWDSCTRIEQAVCIIGDELMRIMRRLIRSHETRDWVRSRSS